ncbi:kinase-like domain-containing protein [Mycena floridula]|nr:kinase-like domain-containing protein [Mycena floridula]
MFDPGVVQRILEHLYVHYTVGFASASRHLCSFNNPCCDAFHGLEPFLNLRLVDSSWNSTIQLWRLSNLTGFFNRIEEAYYPFAWHINTRVRASVLLNRYRVFRTITSENATKGVYLAYDFSKGCDKPRQVIVKAWVNPAEGQTELSVYQRFQSGMDGVPDLLSSGYDPLCDVFALVLQKLGPTLEDIQTVLPGRVFTESMVLDVAIQMIVRYKQIHASGIIHNGMKPANICISNDESSSELFTIDFDLSLLRDLIADAPFPQRWDAIAGNRTFLSVLGHHGISQSQRDDLESLAYLLSYLYHGFLPWDKSSSSSSISPKRRSKSTASACRPQLWIIKTCTPGSVLFPAESFHPYFLTFWKEVKALAYGEIPDYDAMIKGFEEARRDRGAPSVDWWCIWKGQKDTCGPFLHLGT